MFRGFYNSVQAMLNQQRELDIISNNVSNANTAGYRKDEAVLNSFMDELILVSGRTETSGHFLQTYVDTSKTNLEQSNFEYTESRFDFGIWGNVYFNVRNRDGNVYQTRNGQFELDNEGYLILGQSGRVQGQNGDIFIGHDDFEVDIDGVIFNQDGMIDQFLLTYIPPDADVAKFRDNLFEPYEGGAQMPDGEEYKVIQGAFEKSNVDSAKEMSQAIEVHRLYEANSKILQYLDTMNQLSASKLGVVNRG